MPIVDPCVVRLLAEGGAIEVFGRKEPDGSWTFIGRWMSLEFDEEGEDAVTVSGVPTSTDLAQFLPTRWAALVPSKVHPELREWFRTRYENSLAALPGWQRDSHERFLGRKWQALFESTPPDRWSKDDEL